MEIIVQRKNLRDVNRFSDVTYNALAKSISSITKPTQHSVKVIFNEKGENDYAAILKDILKDQLNITPENVTMPSKKAATFKFKVTKDGKEKANKTLSLFQKIKGDEINEDSYLTFAPPYKVRTNEGLEFKFKNKSDLQQLNIVENEDGSVTPVFEYTTSTPNEKQAAAKAAAEAAAESKTTVIVVAVVAVAVVALIATILIIKKKK